MSHTAKKNKKSLTYTLNHLAIMISKTRILLYSIIYACMDIIF